MKPDYVLTHIHNTDALYGPGLTLWFHGFEPMMVHDLQMLWSYVPKERIVMTQQLQGLAVLHFIKGRS